MKAKTKWGFFPFDAIDYKAAQAYLDKKAARGWVLDRLIFHRFARFVPAQGRCHCVDLDIPHAFSDDVDWDYVDFCADAGWELAASARGMLLFRSKPGQAPAPLQTDAGMEAEGFWKRHIRKNLIGTLILTLLLVFLSIFVFSSGYVPVSQVLCGNSVFLLLALAVLWSVLLLRDLICLLRAALCFHRSRTIPRAHPKRAWAFGLLAYLSILLLVFWWGLDFAEGFGLNKTVDAALDPFHEEVSATPELCQSYPVITAADLGLEYSEDSRYLDGERSFLVDHLDYSEITGGENGATHILTTMRYECAGDALARWVFSARLRETARGTDFIWGELEWGEVTSAHGFDQICFARGGAYVLLRQGDTVALVGATGFDLTEHLDTLQTRLALDK